MFGSHREILQKRLREGAYATGRARASNNRSVPVLLQAGQSVERGGDGSRHGPASSAPSGSIGSMDGRLAVWQANGNLAKSAVERDGPMFHRARGKSDADYD
jgi:hypothetical protein